MFFLYLVFACVFCFFVIFHQAFGVAWLWYIKYLSNPWNASLSLFSLVWVSKTHMLTSLPLTKHFYGQLWSGGWGGGAVYECKNTSIFVCQHCTVDTTLKSHDASAGANGRAASVWEERAGLEGMVTSRAAVFVWFCLLSLVYLALRSRCQQSQRPLQFPRHNVFM